MQLKVRIKVFWAISSILFYEQISLQIQAIREIKDL